MRTIMHLGYNPPVIDDLELARAAARAASDAALRLRGTSLSAERKGSATDLVTAADRAAETAAVELLRAERPRDGVIGEEGTMLGGTRIWLVDGIDGTLSFVRGLPGWGSAVALQERGRTLAAAVCDPLGGELFAGGLERGADADGTPARVAQDRALADAVVATHVPTGDAAAAELAGLLARRADLVSGGGSGSLELAWLACGRIDGWIQHSPAPWDWEPGAVLVAEAGGTVTVRGNWHIAGSPQVAAALTALVA
jgi:myo-inositol-1(or 4)-monophosphatase